MTTHVMLDIETLSTKPGALILSAALVRFSDEAHTSINLDMTEQQTLGCVVGQSTVDWWKQQPAEAWHAATVNPLPVRVGLDHLTAWLQWAGPDVLLWCHGATFDAPLLQCLYERLGLPAPWPYWAVRDTRTLYDLAGVDVKAFAVPPPHVALNDAIGQVRAANEALRILSRAHAA